MIDNSGLTDFTINRIKELRLKNKWSQEELSLKAELDPKYINKLENGRYQIKLETLSKILDALQISYFEFFEVRANNENYIINEMISKLELFSEEEQILKIKAIIQLLDW